MLSEIGLSLAIYPITALLAATGAVRQVLSQMRNDGGVALGELPSFSDLHEISGLDEYLDDAREAGMEEKT